MPDPSQKFTIEINPSKIGINTVAIGGVDVDPSKLLQTAQKLCKIKEVRSVATSTGDHMIMTEIWAKNGRELTKIMSERIGIIEGVKKICPSHHPRKAEKLNTTRNKMKNRVSTPHRETINISFRTKSIKSVIL